MTFLIIFVSMKIVKIKGPLGLQMFQYAMFMAVNEIYGDTIMEGKTLLPGNVFQISHSDCFDTQGIRMPWKANPYKNFAEVQNPQNTDDIKNAPENCIFTLDSPSLQCIEGIEESIRQEFRFKQAMPHIYDPEGETVAMHIDDPDRRGNTCTIDYYNWAVANINTFLPGAQFHIFTDNAKWVNRHIAGLPQGTTIHDTRHTTHAELMQAMASARHTIMSASLDDWWAAYLNANPDKIVIAPQRWSGNINPTRLLPLHWTIIPVT